MSAALELRGWLPAAAHWQQDELWVDWLHFGTRPLTEPFFEGEVQRGLRQPFNQLLRPRTSMAALAGQHRRQPGLPPSGFIFHMSRCGSTLVAQMLAASARNVVVSEAAVIDAVLQAGRHQPGLDQQQQAEWLQWMLSALGQPRRGAEQHYFIKFDCWHALNLPLIRRAFPQVPWIFLYREPLEVLVSHLRQRGSQMVPGVLDPALFGIDSAEALRLPAEEYCARVLAVICEAALAHAGEAGARLVNYAQLPQALHQVILPHFGIDLAEADRQGMDEVARYDAKNPSFYFTTDAQSKRNAATEATRLAAEARLAMAYQRLETLRLKRLVTT